MRKLILFLVFLLSISFVNANVLFSDNFEDGNSDGWIEVVDDWQIRNGTYCTDMIGGSTGNVGHVATGSNLWSNYTFKFDVIPKFPATSNGNVIGVYIMAQEPRAFNFNGYAAPVGYNSEVALAKYVNGFPTDIIKLTNPAFTLETGRTHSVKYQKIGDILRLKVWEVGEQEPDWQIQAQDSTYSSGLVAVSTWNTRICIDNVEVTDNKQNQTTNQTSIEERLNRLEERVSELETKAEDLEQRQTALENIVNDLKNIVDELKETINKIAEIIEKLPRGLRRE